MRQVREWRIHIGAHKTATTHVQDTLAVHREGMAARGVDYIPREVFGPLQRRYSNPGHWRRRLWSPPLAALFHRQLAALRQGPDIVLLSDEDLLGYSDDLLAPVLYPRFRGTHLIQSLAHRAPVVLFLSIRAYDTLLPSAYAQLLKSHVTQPAWQSRVAAEVTAAPPSWPDLITRLLETFPSATLRVWQQENYRTHWQTFLTALAGGNMGVFPDLPPPKRTASPSAEAICAAEALPGELSLRNRRVQVRQLYEDFAAREERARWHPYDDKTTAWLKALYAEDLRRIEEAYPGMLLHPKDPVAV